MLLNCSVGEDFWESTAKTSKQSILKEISPEYSLEGLMPKLKLQYFGHLMRRTVSLEKTPMLGKIEVRRGNDREWNGWMALPTQWTWVWVDSESWWWTGRPGMLQSMGLWRVGYDWATELNWNIMSNLYLYSRKCCLISSSLKKPCTCYQFIFHFLPALGNW